MSFPIVLRFYEELNDYMPESIRKRDFQVEVDGSVTAGDVIFGFGIPLNAVDLLLVNGRSSVFSRKLTENDRLSVYPVFETFDITSLARIPKRPLRKLRFIVDNGLETIAVYLGLLGYDTISRFALDRRDFIDAAENAGRILLTRNSTVISERKITRGYLVKSNSPIPQLLEVMHRFDMVDAARHHHSKNMREESRGRVIKKEKP